MKTVAVISEYNPFHLGHAHQFSEIRKDLGEDTAIVAIMSGNYVQRGTPAVLGKFDRARMAIDAGASLVLELPFPYSATSAEYFARAGVSVANDLGIIDHLSFGSECGSIALLDDVAAKIGDPSFEAFFRTQLRAKSEKSKGYAKLLSESLAAFYGDKTPVFSPLPNNILAISYLCALKKINSDIRPHTVFRKGTDEDAATLDTFAGATHLRTLFFEGKAEDALSHIPQELHPLWEEALDRGLAPVPYENFSPILLSFLRMQRPSLPLPAECGGGILALLQKAAREATSLEELIARTATKKYTGARLRRAALFYYFGVTPAMIKQKPLYTQVLAMDARGRAILSHIRKSSRISLLTKPADLHKLSGPAREQAALSYRADSVYALLLPKPQRSDVFLTTAPYRK